MSDLELTMMRRVGELNQENARLKAEVERLTAFTTRTIIPNEELQSENARLKAKVSDLECDAETRYRQGMDDEYEIEWLNKITHGLMKEKEQLQAQVERLTKAGDAMAEDLLKEFGRKEMLKYQPYQDWLAAKEGKGRD
jgi:regulator of replication initiation timing